MLFFLGIFFTPRLIFNTSYRDIELIVPHICVVNHIEYILLRDINIYLFLSIEFKPYFISICM